MTLARLTGVACAGGALGAVVRAWLTDHAPAPTSDSLPWTTLAINVLGCALLAALPALAAVRRSHGWSVFLGTGVLGGFTTMSAAVVVPLADLPAGSAVSYLGLTLGGALAAVWWVDRFVTRG